MTIDQLASGSYRIRKMYHGKNYSITINHKPSTREAKRLIEDLIENNTEGSGMTFEKAADKYINLKINVLSPSTVVGYRKLIRWINTEFKNMDIMKITQEDIQREINLLSANHSAKSVRNTHGFISAVLRLFRPQMNISTTLPQKVKNEDYMPSDDDIRKLLAYCEGSEYEIAIRLALLGLRRSEVVALRYPEDLNGNILTINKALVVNENHEYVQKTTKTTDSTREVYLPDPLVELIHNRGKFYEGHPGNIWKYLDKAQKDLGLPHFRLHALRAYYASTAHALGVPDVYIMNAGGWKSDKTLKEVYRRALEDKEVDMQKKVAEYISKL